MDRKSLQPMVGVVGLTDAEQMEVRGGASGFASNFRNSINNYRNSLRSSGGTTRNNARNGAALAFARYGGSCC